MTSTIKSLNVCRIKFPEIRLHTRDAHKLRGYFGNLFKEYSPLLHNHWENGDFRYRYPVVQYKVIDNIPMLVGIGEGAQLLPQLFLKVKEIDIDDIVYPVSAKNIEVITYNIGYSTNLASYRFATLWMALNQSNYHAYTKLNSEQEKQAMLNSVLIGHILSFFRNMEVELTSGERLMAKVEVKEKATNFKDNKMIAFSGRFVVNALLPDWIGLGKSSARGFGTIVKE